MKKYLKWLFAALLVSAAIIYFTSDGPVKPGTFNPDDFARYDLLISDSVTLQIDSLVTDAIAKYDFSQTKIWFKTRIIVNHDTVKAKIRLKGDKIDHYDSELLSLRLKYKENGVKRIVSLQHPKTRRYISEWIFYKLLKHEGLPYLDYNFVSVYINNQFKGLYAEEEHFSSPNIEQKWNRDHGPILCFDDEKYWPEGLKNFTREFDNKCYLEAEIRSFNCSKSEKKTKLFQRATEQLKGYQQGKLAANIVFDMDLMAKYYALVDLVGAPHSLRWLNCRFYYNPTSRLFEPVGFDSDTRRINGLVKDDKDLNPSHHGKIFADSTFKASYGKYLSKYAKGSFLDEFFEPHEKELDKYVSAFKDQFQTNTESQKNFAYINQWIILLNIINKPLAATLALVLIFGLIIGYRKIKRKRSNRIQKNDTESGT